MRPKQFATVLWFVFCLLPVHAEWIKQKTNSLAWFKDIFFINQQKGWIVGMDGTILSTVDGGANWVQARKFTTDAFLQVHFTDENTGWLLCERDIYAPGASALSYLRKTTDGGRNWEKIEFEGAGRERITKVLFDNWGRALAFGEGGVFYKLQEDGVTWKRFHTAFHFLLLDGAFGDRDIGAIAGAGGTIMFTENSGSTWANATIIGDTNVRFNGIFFVGPKNGWAVGSNGSIFHSIGGRLWRQQESGTRADLNDVYFTNATSGWAVGDGGVIVRTSDGGRTWMESGSHVTHKLERIVFTGRRGWAIGFGGTILTYSEAGDSGGKPPLLTRN